MIPTRHRRQFSTPMRMPVPEVDIPKSAFESSGQESNMNDIFKGKVGMDDPLWEKYLDNANKFDEHIVDGWNKIVDVVLVWVGLFIQILTTFITNTSFTVNPADTTNHLLKAIYNHLANNSAPIDTAPFFTQDKTDSYNAVLMNGLLYAALALSIVVSVIALAAKLWLVKYSDCALDTLGTPYERAIKRQEAYTGVLEWKMGAVISMLPLILLVAVILFAFFVHISISSDNIGIGYAVGVILTVGIASLAVTSLAAAFIPSCPFRSSFSTFIELLFKYSPRKYLTLKKKEGETSNWGRKRVLRWFIVLLLWFGSGCAIAYGAMIKSSIFLLICFPVAITFAFTTELDPKDHKPQRYWLPQLSLIIFLLIGSILSAAGYFSNSYQKHIFIPLYCVGMILVLISGAMMIRLAKSMTNTAEIDAVAWLLKSTPFDGRDGRDLLVKACKIASNNHPAEYQNRLLESLMPLFSIILSHANGEMTRVDDNSTRKDLEKDLEIYVSCLELLSAFEETKKRCIIREYVSLRSWEAQKRLPSLEPDLKKILLKLESRGDLTNANLKRATAAVLQLYDLKSDNQGWGGLKSWPGRRQRSGDSDDSGSMTTLTGDAGSMMLTELEAAHTYEEDERRSTGNRRHKYFRVDTA